MSTINLVPQDDQGTAKFEIFIEEQFQLTRNQAADAVLEYLTPQANRPSSPILGHEESVPQPERYAVVDGVLRRVELGSPPGASILTESSGILHLGE